MFCFIVFVILVVCDCYVGNLKEKNVLVVGESGVGKTTLVNALCGTDFKTGDSMTGVTTEEQTGSFIFGDTKYNLVDIVGLSGAASDKYDRKKSILELVKTMAKHKGEFHLVLFVTNAIQWITTREFNFNLAKTLIGKNVPFIYVVNGRAMIRNRDEVANEAKERMDNTPFQFDSVLIGNFADKPEEQILSEKKLIYRDNSIKELKKRIDSFSISKAEEFDFEGKKFDDFLEWWKDAFPGIEFNMKKGKWNKKKKCEFYGKISVGLLVAASSAFGGMVVETALLFPAIGPACSYILSSYPEYFEYDGSEL